mgnify:CR=1 FL=1
MPPTRAAGGPLTRAVCTRDACTVTHVCTHQSRAMTVACIQSTAEQVQYDKLVQSTTMHNSENSTRQVCRSLRLVRTSLITRNRRFFPSGMRLPSSRSRISRGHGLEFGTPGQSHLVEDVSAARSGRGLRITRVPRRFRSTSSSSASSSSSMHDGAIESNGSGNDEPGQATSEVSSVVLDVYDTRPCLRGLSKVC